MIHKRSSNKTHAPQNQWPINRLLIDFWSKSGSCPDFSCKKAGHTRTQSIFEEKYLEKRENKDFRWNILQKSGAISLKVRKWTAYPLIILNDFLTAP
jgi:hypothetical protein